MLEKKEVIFNTKVDNILKTGIDLTKIGIYNWIFSYRDIFKKLNELKDNNIDIIGCDIYTVVDDKFQLTYLGIGLNLKQGNDESDSDFRKRCYQEIKHFFIKLNNAENYYFSITPYLK